MAEEEPAGTKRHAPPAGLETTPSKKPADSSLLVCATVLADFPAQERVRPEGQSDDETDAAQPGAAAPANPPDTGTSAPVGANIPDASSAAAADCVTAEPAQPSGVSNSVGAATAAADAIQQALMTVKQEQDTLAEREKAIKRQRSKAARFCADSRARRRLRTMIFEGASDPATQQLRLAQMQQLQQSQLRSQVPPAPR
jgi:hypothetical protein